MNIQGVKSKLTVLLAVMMSVVFSTIVSGQAMPGISVRFANPQFDVESRTYFLDVEMRAAEAPQHLFGMNLRFFYDASVLEFRQLDQFHAGYGIQGEAPKVFVGNSSSGALLFSFPQAAGYVNGAVQLLNDHSPMTIPANQWVKAFRAAFLAPSHLVGQESFCPSLVWDMKPGLRAGGFLPGSDGLLVTVLETDPNTRETTAPTIATGLAFNWEYSDFAGMPYGAAFSEVCIPLGALTSTNNVIAVDGKGYALFQNQPNPFAQQTMIEFILPRSQEARLSFFDATGKIIKVVKGDFHAGRNAINIERAAWMDPSGVLFYRLESGEYISGMKKMTLINP